VRALRIVSYGVVVGVLACGGGSGGTNPTSQTGSTAVTGTTTANVSVVEYSFSPSTVTVKVGSTVQWTNNGQLTHNVTADDASWSSGNLTGASGGGGYGGGTSGAAFSQVFSQVGTFTYHCSLHPPANYPGFVGTVIVTQ
jgi:plastocyanin